MSDLASSDLSHNRDSVEIVLRLGPAFLGADLSHRLYIQSHSAAEDAMQVVPF